MSFEILQRYTGAVWMLWKARAKNLVGANLDRAKISDATKIDRVAITLVGSRHVITAYADRVRIGCHERSYERWLKIYRTVGEREDYTAEQIEEYHALILQAQAMFAVSAQEPSAQ